MRNGLLIGVLGLALAGACHDAANLMGPPVTSRKSMAGPDKAEYQIRGVTYGADGGELTNGTCDATYSGWQDSTNWGSGAVQPIWVQWYKYDKVGCALTGDMGGDFYVGGDVGISVQGPSGQQVGLDIWADDQTIATVSNAPVTGTTVYVTATAASQKYRFMYWEIATADGSIQYRDYHRDIMRPGDTDEYDFLAIFKECKWNGYNCANDPNCFAPWEPISCNAPPGYAMMRDEVTKSRRLAWYQHTVGFDDTPPSLSLALVPAHRPAGERRQHSVRVGD